MEGRTSGREGTWQRKQNTGCVLEIIGNGFRFPGKRVIAFKGVVSHAGFEFGIWEVLVNHFWFLS